MTDWLELSNCGHTKCCLYDQPAAVLESLWLLGNITRDLISWGGLSVLLTRKCKNRLRRKFRDHLIRVWEITMEGRAKKIPAVIRRRGVEKSVICTFGVRVQDSKHSRHAGQQGAASGLRIQKKARWTGVRESMYTFVAGIWKRDGKKENQLCFFELEFRKVSRFLSERFCKHLLQGREELQGHWLMKRMVIPPISLAHQQQNQVTAAYLRGSLLIRWLTGQIRLALQEGDTSV